MLFRNSASAWIYALMRKRRARMSHYHGLIEFMVIAAVTLVVLAWQYWQVRDAGKP
jgi:hypothetical protein